MKTIFAITLLLGLSACYQTVNQFDIDRAIAACGGKEEIVNIAAHLNGNETVHCADGEVKELSEFSTKGKK